MAFEKFFMLPNDEYGKGYVIQEYNGKWYIQEAQEAKDGKIYKTWMSKYKRKGEFLCKDNGEPYVFPLSIEIPQNVANAIIDIDVQPTVHTDDDDDSLPF